MGTSWEDLLDMLVEFRSRQFATDPERDEARLEQLEFIVQTMLEMLRDRDQR